MPSIQEKLETNFIYNSLVCVVKALEGNYTSIDLRNESCVTGKVENVDGFMNVEMSDVIFYDPRGELHSFETFFVQKRMIRYVHLPKGVPANQLAIDCFERIKRPRPPPRKGRTFKEKRAQKYHMETVKNLNKPQS